VFQAECVKGILAEGKATELTRNKLDQLTDRTKKMGAKGLAWFKVGEGGALESPLTKFLSDDEQKALASAMGASPGDVMLLVADEWMTVCDVLGQVRNDLGRPPVSQGPYRYVWIVDFPMFVGVSEDGRPKPAHHPFTRPHPDDIDKLDSDPTSVRSQAYDLVLNGWELGSGSIRIHEPALQQRVFDLIGIDEEEANKRFGFFLTPFRYGAPPHGGFAIGTERLIAILAGEENIREVIAFPKTQSGQDPLTGAPAPLDDAALAEYGLRKLPPRA
jgi:aspartyl-tRNA synthetase